MLFNRLFYLCHQLVYRFCVLYPITGLDPRELHFDPLRPILRVSLRAAQLFESGMLFFAGSLGLKSTYERKLIATQPRSLQGIIA